MSIEELFEEYNDMIVGSLVKLGARVEDAEDACSQAWCYLMEKEERDESTFTKSYVFELAKNKLIDIWRRGGRRIEREKEYSERYMPYLEHKAEVNDNFMDLLDIEAE